MKRFTEDRQVRQNGVGMNGNGSRSGQRRKEFTPSIGMGEGFRLGMIQIEPIPDHELEEFRFMNTSIGLIAIKGDRIYRPSPCNTIHVLPGCICRGKVVDVDRGFHIVIIKSMDPAGEDHNIVRFKAHKLVHPRTHSDSHSSQPRSLIRMAC